MIEQAQVLGCFFALHRGQIYGSKPFFEFMPTFFSKVALIMFEDPKNEVISPWAGAGSTKGVLASLRFPLFSLVEVLTRAQSTNESLDEVKQLMGENCQFYVQVCHVNSCCVSLRSPFAT